MNSLSPTLSPSGRGSQYLSPMNWFDSPPCPRMEVTHASDELISLKGPSTGAKIAGGATAAFGGVFATVGAGFLRLPIPLPFKLIPLVFTAIGAGLAAAGTSAALSECSVEAKRGEGLTMRWKLPARAQRSLVIRTDELEAFEVTEHQHSTSDDFGNDNLVLSFHLVAVTRDGRAVAFESLGTRTQARLRKEAFEKVLLSV